jgi:hypothetical protein
MVKQNGEERMGYLTEGFIGWCDDEVRPATVKGEWRW